MHKNSKNLIILLAVAVLVSLTVGVVSAAPVTQSINYQGKLTDAAGNPLTGTYSVTFSLYEVSTGATALATDTHTVQASKGLFTTQITADPSFFDGRALWLGIKVGADAEMTPRQELRPVPYTLGLRPWVVGASFTTISSGTSYSDLRPGVNVSTVSTFNPGALIQTNGLYSDGVRASTSGTGSFGVVASTSGTGSDGMSASTSGTGSHGVLARTSGHASHGVLAYTRGTDSDGVNVVTTGTNSKGVFAQTSGDNSNALFGSTSGLSSYGVYGIASGNDNCGVAGGTTGSGSPGVFGTTTGPNSPAIRGESAQDVGVYGEGATKGVQGKGVTGVLGVGIDRNPFLRIGVGVFGEGTSYGVRGNSTDGYGVEGKSSSNDGVLGISDSSYGVHGYSESNYGVFAESEKSTGVYGKGRSAGIIGESTNGAPGVFAKTSGSGTGVYATAGPDPYARGVWAVAHNQGTAVVAQIDSGTGTGIAAYGGPQGGPAGKFYGNVQILQKTSPFSVLLELGEGLDYSEGFNVSGKDKITPGTVLIISPDDPGTLTISSEPYDRKVAGIAAGANGVGSAVKVGGELFDTSVALAGRVYCNVDTTYGAIVPGDLLTTSATPGYAMVVQDHSRSQGSTIGKAMEGLEKGKKGQVLVLVTLQ